MPKVRKTRKSLHYVNNDVSNRKFAISADKVEKVVIGSAHNEEESNEKEKSHSKIPHTKKEKAKERHEKWVKKFDPTNTKKKKKKKKSRKMDICEEEHTFNISKLKEYIDKEFESTSSQDTQKKPQISNLGLKINPVKSKSARKNVAMSEIQRFHKILHHSAFRADPLSIIKQHVENTIEKKRVVDDKIDKSSMNVD